MKLSFSSLLHPSYFEALSIVKKEQPKLWDVFCQEISTFSAVFSFRLAGIITHFRYQKAIRESAEEYRAIWKAKEKRVIPVLESLFGVRLTGKKGRAYVCITPLYLRNIEKGFFLLPAGSEEARILSVIIHELSHFYCYEGFRVYGYQGEDQWEISEYLVPFLLHAYFYDICEENGTPYTGEAPDRYKERILLWMNRKITFEEMLEQLSKCKER